ncbi:MAG: signal peptidase II [Clostridia bacterium]|nr:signal peptidase II [Clostridia bacterium]
MSIIGAVLFVLSLVGIDQVVKYFVIEYLKPVGIIEVIEGFIRLRYIENTGAVFGSFAAHTALLTVVSIILLGVTIYFLFTQKNKSKLVNFSLLLMISGGIGNIIDRIRLHYVVDYIEPTFIDFAVFNFADCLITVGAFVLMIYLIADMAKDAKNSKSPVKDDEFLKDDTVIDNERN